MHSLEILTRINEERAARYGRIEELTARRYVLREGLLNARNKGRTLAAASYEQSIRDIDHQIHVERARIAGRPS